jgi:ElaB/YqjD/DUF883 family membrane-anchored ribosome-binding protein
MERNDDLMNTTGSTGGLGNSSSSPTFGSAGSTGGMGAGSTSGMGGAGMGAGMGATGSDLTNDSNNRMQQAKDAAADKLGQAKSAVSSGLGTVKEKASNLNTTLADKLEAGANKLRQSAQGGSGSPYAPSTGMGGAAALEGDASMGQLGTKAADALQGTANFLREGDLKASIEEQVRTNPARTLLVALGVGYVLGKALRGSDR